MAGAGSDKPPFDEVVREHQAAVFRYARSLGADPERAEDILQETFVAAMRGYDDFRGDASLKSWLFLIERRVAGRLARRRSGEPKDFDDLTALGVAAGWGSELTPEGHALQSERREAVQRALVRLSSTDQEVIVLSDLEGFAGAEVAEIMQLTPAAVRTRLHRARLRFVAALKREGVSHGG